MSGAAVAVGVNKPFNDRIVVAGLEVIPSRLFGMAVSFLCCLDKKSAEKVANIPVLSASGFLAGTTIQGLI